MIPEELKDERKKMNQLAKKKRNQHTYENRKKTTVRCDVCKCEVSKYYYEKHLLTKRHQNWSELLANADLFLENAYKGKPPRIPKPDIQ